MPGLNIDGTYSLTEANCNSGHRCDHESRTTCGNAPVYQNSRGGYVLFRAVMDDGSSGWVVGDSRALTECECPIDKSRGLGNYAYRFNKDGQSPGAPDDDTTYGGWQGLWGLAIAANSGH